MIEEIEYLPETMQIEGVTCIRHYTTRHAIVYQGYSPSGSQSHFAVFKINLIGQKETLGELVASYDNVNEAIIEAGKVLPP